MLSRRVGSVTLSVVLAMLIAAPQALAGTGSPVSSAANSDLVPALAPDGTFVGSEDVRGSVDASAWTLVSDIGNGEPPRFAPADTGDATAPTAHLVGPVWWNLGSNGAGVGALANTVHALAISGSNLYVGGTFTNAAGIAEADYVARWDGSAWSALGSNGAGVGALGKEVYALAVSGSDVYVGGDFTNAAGIAEADHVARWNGSTWSALGSNVAGDDGALGDNVMALAISGSDLYAGGLFTNAAGIAEADWVARWNGSVWSALGSNEGGDNGALGDLVRAIAISGSDVYVGGFFTNAAGIDEADHVARWNGSTWSALGSNVAGDDGALGSAVNALAISGSNVYAGGLFTNAAGFTEADYVARWNGSAWSAVGAMGPGEGALDNYVQALAISGSDLYVGGFFKDAAGFAEADHVARWNGSTWSELGSNGVGVGALNNTVWALAISGFDVYAGGDFTDAQGIFEADHVARFGLPVPELVSIEVTPADPTISLGANQQFTATGFYDDLTEVDLTLNVTWASSDETVATINASGLATSVGLGTTTISATLGLSSDNSMLTVESVAPISRQPDGEIRRGSSGPFVGNDTYNLTGVDQTVSVERAKGKLVRFRIRIQNDGTRRDRFFLLGPASADGYKITYKRASKNITAKVVAGTLRTALLKPGKTRIITVVVRVTGAATIGSTFDRLVTLTSEADPTKQDTVKFEVTRI